MFDILDGNKSYRKRKSFKKNTKRDTLLRNAYQTLGLTKNYERAVKLPENEDENEWFCVHLTDFYNKSNLIIGPVEKKLMEMHENRVGMKVGRWEFNFKDESDPKYEKPVAVTCFDYIDLTLRYVEKRLMDEAIFPLDGKFPKETRKVVKDCFKRLFRVFAFLCVSMMKTYEEISMQHHVNTVVKHFMTFVFTFKIISATRLQPINSWAIVHMTKYCDKLKLSSDQKKVLKRVQKEKKNKK